MLACILGGLDKVKSYKVKTTSKDLCNDRQNANNCNKSSDFFLIETNHLDKQIPLWTAINNILTHCNNDMNQGHVTIR